jgi:O-antigen/teichoic acid export membrane protein
MYRLTHEEGLRMLSSHPPIQCRLNLSADTSLSLPALSSVVQRTLPSLISVIGGEFLLRIASFLVVLLIARSYGASVLGLFATALAYSTLAITAGEGGLQTSAIERINRNPGDIHRIVSQLFLAKTLVFFPLGLAGVLFCVSLGLSREVWIVGGLVTVRSLIQSYCQLQLAILKSINRMLSIGAIQLAHFVALIGGIAAAHQYSWGFHNLLAWMVGCQTLELMLSAGWLWKNGVRPQGVALGDCWNLLWGSYPVGFTNLMATFIVRVDVIILSFLVSTPEVGRFSAAHMLLVVVYIVSWLFGSVLLPNLVQLAANGNSLDSYLRQWTRLLLWTTVPGTVILFWLAPPVMRALYGSAFAQSGVLASIMVLAVPCILLNSLYMNRAVALRSPSVYVGTYLMTAGLALVLGLVLGGTFGSMGIAVAIVGRELAMLGIFYLRSPSMSPQLA